VRWRSSPCALDCHCQALDVHVNPQPWGHEEARCALWLLGPPDARLTDAHRGPQRLQVSNRAQDGE